jgi:diphthamide biosynthesis protein 4
VCDHDTRDALNDCLIEFTLYFTHVDPSLPFPTRRHNVAVDYGAVFLYLSPPLSHTHTYTHKRTYKYTKVHMSTCTWSYTERTPYEVLRVPSNASISDIRTAFKRMALCTHPDKQHGTTNVSDMEKNATPPATVPNDTPVSFYVVKAASEILLDPYLRAAYDAARSHALVREVGAVSDTFSLADDFELVAMSDEGGDAQVHVYQCECRCGGVYEVVLFAEAAATVPPEGRKRRSECDSCSLVVEVLIS